MWSGYTRYCVYLLIDVGIINISFQLSFKVPSMIITGHCVYVQVLASRKKIFIILEFITGGELFDKIVRFLSS